MSLDDMKESERKFKMIKDLEKSFIRSPCKDIGIMLDLLCTNFVEDPQHHGHSDKIKHRMMLYANYVMGEMNDKEIIGELEKDPLYQDT